MALHELAGKPAPRELLVHVPRLVTAFYTHRPDPNEPSHRVSFGTSGHRGSSLDHSFNEHHILAIVQAICEYRASEGITGPLYLGMDTHALSEPAQAVAIEVLAANGVDTRITKEFTPTPVISHAILTYNAAKTQLLNAQSEMSQAKYEYIFKIKVLDFYKGLPLTLNK